MAHGPGKNLRESDFSLAALGATSQTCMRAEGNHVDRGNIYATERLDGISRRPASTATQLHRKRMWTEACRQCVDRPAHLSQRWPYSRWKGPPEIPFLFTGRRRVVRRSPGSAVGLEFRKEGCDQVAYGQHALDRPGPVQDDQVAEAAADHRICRLEDIPG
jgi:hypothetical protein